jgi:tetratricopeptide (TPR) repeat protein
VVADSPIRRSKIQREAEGYLELGMPKHALRALARLGDPTDYGPHILFLWGEALRALSRYEEALVPLGQSAEAAPENVHVWIALGWCHKRTGRVDLAIQSLEKALVIDPDAALLHYNLACYWRLIGNKRRTLKYLSHSLAIEPGYRDLIDDEPDFDNFRFDADFQALREGAEV